MSPSTSLTSDGREIRRANTHTIQDKFLVGYQGWFTCAGDGQPVHRGHHGWLHWFDKPIPNGGRPCVDMWPDMSEYSPSELYPAPGLTLQNGAPACLFSSRNPSTVDRHFHWMARHGVDGAFLQRFASQCEVDGHLPGQGGNADLMALRDEVLRVCRAAAEKAGRVFAVMYDVSGVSPERIEHVIRTDWAHLVHDLAVLDSPSYLREEGKPVIALWGFGFARRGHSPETVRNIVRHLRYTTPGGAYIMAGAPTHWATLSGDADPNAGFRDVWLHEFDAISPWSVGRYGDEDAADRFAVERLRGDLNILKASVGRDGKKVDYVPVVFPGFSGYNLTQGKWKYNEIPRNGGKFFWRQIYNARKEGARIIYGAMWDEYDEGTVLLPVAPNKRLLPRPGAFLALDAEGQDLPSDWYMRICGFAAEILHGEQQLREHLPVKELMDYWTGRPKYEPRFGDGAAGTSGSGSALASASGSAGAGASSSSTWPAAVATPATPVTPSASEGIAQSFEEWSTETEELKDELPPPPYSLEATEAEAVPVDEQTGAADAPLEQQHQQPGTHSNNTLSATAPLTHSPSAPARPLEAPASTGQIPAARPHSTQSIQSTHSTLSVHSSHSMTSSSSGGVYNPPSRTSSLTVGPSAAPHSSSSNLSHSTSLGHTPAGALHHVTPGGRTSSLAHGGCGYGHPQYPPTPTGARPPSGGRLSPIFPPQPGVAGLSTLTDDFGRATLTDTATPHAYVHAGTGAGSQPHSPLPPHSPGLAVGVALAPHSPLPHTQPISCTPPQSSTPNPGAGRQSGIAELQWPPPEWRLPTPSLAPASGAAQSHAQGTYNPLTEWTRPPPSLHGQASHHPPPMHAHAQQQQQQPQHEHHPQQAPWAFDVQMPQASMPSSVSGPTQGEGQGYGRNSAYPNSYGYGSSPEPGLGSSFSGGYFLQPDVPLGAAQPHVLPPRTSSFAPGGGAHFPSPFETGPDSSGSPSPRPSPGLGPLPSPGGGDNPALNASPGLRPAPLGQSYFPQGPSSSATVPGSYLPPPPPPRLPARPPTIPTPSTATSSSTAQSGRAGIAGLGGVAAGAYSVALGTVDKVAGANTRKQLEKGVDTLAASGSKLFGKLMK